VLKNVSEQRCRLVGRPGIHLRPRFRSQRVTAANGRGRQPAGGVLLEPGSSAVFALFWANWCGPIPTELRITLTGGGGTITIPNRGAPPCADRRRHSVIRVGQYEPLR
jgi:hypothetical protein